MKSKGDCCEDGWKPWSVPYYRRTLSANGNPTLKTLLAVPKTVGMKLSVEPEERAAA